MRELLPRYEVNLSFTSQDLARLPPGLTEAQVRNCEAVRNLVALIDDDAIAHVLEQK